MPYAATPIVRPLDGCWPEPKPIKPKRFDLKGFGESLFCFCLVMIIPVIGIFGQEPEELPAPPADKPNEVYTILKRDTDEFSGTVVSVHDGDTVKVQVSRWREGSREVYPQIATVRLAGVDAPEIKQPHGPESGKFLAWMVGGKQITVKWDEKDRYGRYVGVLFPDYGAKVQFFSDLTSINGILLENGMAWHYKAYDASESYSNREKQAQKSKIGLWFDQNREAPWDFRRRTR